MERTRVPALSPYADSVGYSRAARAGPHVMVAGTAAIMPRDADPPADAYGQAKRCFEIIVDALAELGARPEHVVRTRLYVTAPEHLEGVGQAHGEVFGAARPACTAVIAGLLDPRWVCEIEADAIVPE